MKTLCKTCNQIKTKKKFNRYSPYVDENDRRWNGKICPDCHINNLNNKYYKKHPNIIKICEICKKDFSTRKESKRFCSNTCYKISNKKVYSNKCEKCGKSWNSNKKGRFCSKNCRMWNYKKENPDKVHQWNKISKKESKRLRKRAERQRKLKTVTWKQIYDIYQNCPEGYHVDHIIPLNHPEVSGLHVPWNLQYLTINENQIKGNQFDGTYQNENWKTSNKK